MARYKYIDTNPRFLAVDLARQLLPGTFEHALNHLLDHAIDLSAFDARFRNDATGATAYPPAMLLKCRCSLSQSEEPWLEADRAWCRQLREDRTEL